MKLRTLLIGLAALFVALNSAYFSIVGLSKLFAGSSETVIFMAASLELAKLVSASFLYIYWNKINKVIRTYLLIGVVVLITITSAGIYGYLTSAYQTTADNMELIDNKTEVVNMKRSRFQDQLDTYVVEKSELTLTITELSKGLSNNVIQYKDKETGEIITTTSVNTRNILTEQLNETKERREEISDDIISISDSIAKLDEQLLEIKQSSNVAAEIGPLKYLAEVTGKPMNQIVSWFALFIIFVFDPLAVSLVVAFNTAFKFDKEKKDTDIEKKKVEKRIQKKLDKQWKKLENSGLDKPFKPEVKNNDKSKSSKKVGSIDKSKHHPADANKDGEVTEDEKRRYYEQTGWKNSHNGQPYYMHKWFDWKKYDRWIWDEAASTHWLKHLGGSKEGLRRLRQEHPKNK